MHQSASLCAKKMLEIIWRAHSENFAAIINLPKALESAPSLGSSRSESSRAGPGSTTKPMSSGNCASQGNTWHSASLQDNNWCPKNNCTDDIGNPFLALTSRINSATLIDTQHSGDNSKAISPLICRMHILGAASVVSEFVFVRGAAVVSELVLVLGTGTSVASELEVVLLVLGQRMSVPVELELALFLLVLGQRTSVTSELVL